MWVPWLRAAAVVVGSMFYVCMTSRMSRGGPVLDCMVGSSIKGGTGEGGKGLRLWACRVWPRGDFCAVDGPWDLCSWRGEWGEISLQALGWGQRGSQGPKRGPRHTVRLQQQPPQGQSSAAGQAMGRGGWEASLLLPRARWAKAGPPRP